VSNSTEGRQPDIVPAELDVTDTAFKSDFQGYLYLDVNDDPDFHGACEVGLCLGYGSPEDKSSDELHPLGAIFLSREAAGKLGRMLIEHAERP
jgi:hypothetical protein